MWGSVVILYVREEGCEDPWLFYTYVRKDVRIRGYFICTRGRMWGSVVIFRSQKGIREQRSLGERWYRLLYNVWQHVPALQMNVLPAAAMWSNWIEMTAKVLGVANVTIVHAGCKWPGLDTTLATLLIVQDGYKACGIDWTRFFQTCPMYRMDTRLVALTGHDPCKPEDRRGGKEGGIQWIDRRLANH
jgi:hypothetical protein